MGPVRTSTCATSSGRLRETAVNDARRLSFWHSIIPAAGEDSQAAQLLTEDLSLGVVLSGRRLVHQGAVSAHNLPAALGPQHDFDLVPLPYAG